MTNGRMLFIAIVCFVLASIDQSVSQISGLRELKIVSEWSSLDYVFPRPDIREAAIRNQQFVQGIGVPIDVDVDYQINAPSRIFVTIPRFITGIPVTLGYVASGPGNLIQPYPDYSWHSSHGRDCDGITSVFRIAIDACRRLWILDTGRIGINQLCAPQLLVFNLENDRLIHRYRFPQNQYKPGVSLFITPVLDVADPPPTGACYNTRVYIADVTGFGLLVYDSQANRSWRVQNKLFYSNPEYGTHTVAGESFDLMDGVFGLALTPRNQIGGKTLNGFYPYPALYPNQPNYLNSHNHFHQHLDNRKLYFHALASNTENSVPLRVLDNATAFDGSADSFPRQFTEVGRGQVQVTAEAMDSNGNLFFGIENPSAIGCWNIQKTYDRSERSIVARNEQTLQFTSGMKVIRNKKSKEELWALSCRFQKTMTGTINPREINFRIQALQIDELIGGTICGGSGGTGNRPSAYGY